MKARRRCSEKKSSLRKTRPSWTRLTAGLREKPRSIPSPLRGKCDDRSSHVPDAQRRPFRHGNGAQFRSRRDDRPSIPRQKKEAFERAAAWRAVSAGGAFLWRNPISSGRFGDPRLDKRPPMEYNNTRYNILQWRDPCPENQPRQRSRSSTAHSG